MAYNTQTDASQAGKTQSEQRVVFRTGLFAPRAGSKTKAVASVRIKEAVTLAPGQFINLYIVDDKSRFKDASKAPEFNITIVEGSGGKDAAGSKEDTKWKHTGGAY